MIQGNGQLFSVLDTMPTLPFDRPNLLRSRYAAIVPPGARSPMSSDDECDETEKRETQPYAAFLKWVIVRFSVISGVSRTGLRGGFQKSQI